MLLDWLCVNGLYPKGWAHLHWIFIRRGAGETRSSCPVSKLVRCTACDTGLGPRFIVWSFYRPSWRSIIAPSIIVFRQSMFRCILRNHHFCESLLIAVEMTMRSSPNTTSTLCSSFYILTNNVQAKVCIIGLFFFHVLT